MHRSRIGLRRFGEVVETNPKVEHYTCATAGVLVFNSSIRPVVNQGNREAVNFSACNGLKLPVYYSRPSVHQ
jgi:hypothetical protein